MKVGKVCRFEWSVTKSDKYPPKRPTWFRRTWNKLLELDFGRRAPVGLMLSDEHFNIRSVVNDFYEVREIKFADCNAPFPTSSLVNCRHRRLSLYGQKNGIKWKKIVNGINKSRGIKLIREANLFREGLDSPMKLLNAIWDNTHSFTAKLFKLLGFLARSLFNVSVEDA